MQMHNKNILKI